MGAGAWEEQRPLQRGKPGGLLTPSPASNGLPRDAPQNRPAFRHLTPHLQDGSHLCLLPHRYLLWLAETCGAEDGQTRHPQGRRRTTANSISHVQEGALGRPRAPLLGIRLKFRAMAEMFLSFPNALFIMQKSALQPSVTGCDSCLAAQDSPAVREGSRAAWPRAWGPQPTPGRGTRGWAGTTGIGPSTTRVDGTA